LSPAVFRVNQEFTSATLNTTLEVFDYVAEKVLPVQVNLVWTTTGDAVHAKDRYRPSASGWRMELLETGSFRHARAVGSVSLSGSPNLTPQRSQGERTRIASIKQGTIKIVP
jgi:hypothetical protein